MVWKLISSANDIKGRKSCCTRLWAGRTAWLWLPSCPGRQSRQGDRMCDMCQVSCEVPCSSPSLRAPLTPASMVATPCRAVPGCPARDPCPAAPGPAPLPQRLHLTWPAQHELCSSLSPHGRAKGHLPFSPHPSEAPPSPTLASCRLPQVGV